MQEKVSSRVATTRPQASCATARAALVAAVPVSQLCSIAYACSLLTTTAAKPHLSHCWVTAVLSRCSTRQAAPGVRWVLVKVSAELCFGSVSTSAGSVFLELSPDAESTRVRITEPCVAALFRFYCLHYTSLQVHGCGALPQNVQACGIPASGRPGGSGCTSTDDATSAIPADSKQQQHGHPTTATSGLGGSQGECRGLQASCAGRLLGQPSEHANHFALA
jgi:hypothetical protein